MAFCKWNCGILIKRIVVIFAKRIAVFFTERIAVIFAKKINNKNQVKIKSTIP